MIGVFGKTLRAFPVPTEALQIRVAGAAAGEFVSTGREVAAQIDTFLSEYGVELPPRGKVYDFGCGPGRVVAALRARHGGVAFFGSDIDQEAINWCAANMRETGAFFVNGSLPPLDVPDGQFDFIYSISTFTHFPEDMQHVWLAELRRVLKPGGYLLTTKINPFAYDLPENVRADATASGFAYWGEASKVDGLPDFYRLAYHTADYVRRVWGAYFEVIHVGRHDLNYTQDAVLLRKPRSSRLNWLRPFWPGKG